MIREGLDWLTLRKAKDLSQAQLAEEVGVSQATVSRLEKGEYEPSLQLLVKIARVLEVDLRDILPEETLKEILGQREQERFYAFCPNPFCRRNETSMKDGIPSVTWKSGEVYPIDRFNSVNFCTRCGTDLAKECPSCGRLLEQRETAYCISCGTEITPRPTEEEWARIRALHEPDADDIPF